jgi:putative ABC transport system permease protein
VVHETAKQERCAQHEYRVGAWYFTTLDLPVVAGRAFDDRDAPDSVQVCIVNEAFVRSHVQGRSPIGLRLAIRPTGSAQAPPVVREIVGVARQVKGRPTETEDLIQIYVPLAQDTPGDIFMLVRGRRDGWKSLRHPCVRRWRAWTGSNW